MAFDAFISYSHTDKAIADAACATLETAGTRCWIAPRDVPPGSEWAGAIVSGIDHCRVLVLIFSSQANISNQIHREVERAVSKGIPIIPLRIEEVKPSSSMEYFLSSIHWLDALTPPLEKHLQRLAETVKSCLDFNQNGGDPLAQSDPTQPVAISPSAISAIKSSPEDVRRDGSIHQGGAQLHRRPVHRWTVLVAFCLLILACGGAALLYLKSGQGTKEVRAAEVVVPPVAQQTAAAPAEQQQIVPPVAQDVRQFDGIWIGTLVCKSTPSGLPGWRHQLVGRVRNGGFHSQLGPEGKPGSETYDGMIEPDGTAVISQKGFSGETKTDPFHRPKGTEFRNTYVGNFDGSHGTLTQLDRASCNIDFITQTKSQRSREESSPTAPR